MARPTKQGIDYFPLWKPQMRTEEKFWENTKRGYKALKNSSNGFVHKKDVRIIIMNKCNNQCIFCNSKDNLQIDHIISIYQAYKTKELIGILNTYQNLQILCQKCNAAKNPEEKIWEE